MEFWRTKRAKEEAAHPGVAAVAASAAPREEWVREAIYCIVAATAAERVGVWLETDTTGQPTAQGVFRGMVWDCDAPETPLEWRTLSAEAPLPQSVLTGTGSMEVNLEGSLGRTVLGPLLELRRALWVPVQTQRQLRGLVLAGVKRRAGSLRKEPVERAAAELALALECEQERRKARGCQRDLAVSRELLRSFRSGASLDALLTRLVETCVTPLAPDTPAALFAAVGIADTAQAAAGELRPVPFIFPWTAGDSSLAPLQSGPISEAWRAALQGCRVVGIELQISGRQGLLGRAIALPLTASGQTLGVLVAVLPSAAASLAALERLELRAALAAAFLAQGKAYEERRLQEDLQRSALKDSAQATLLVDRAGTICELSSSASELLIASGTPASRAAPEQIGLPLSTFFRHSSRESLGRWLKHQASPTPQAGGHSSLLEAELENGSHIRLHSLGPAFGSALMLFLESTTPFAGGLAPESVETELHGVIEWLEEGVVFFDAHDNVRVMNMRFQQMTGLSSEESGKHKTLGALIARLEAQAADPLAFAQGWRALARDTEGGVREELQMLRPVPRVLERSARPVLDSVGRLLGRVEIYRDLTAQRVFQSKLLQTEKLAALGQMLTGVAHELSNPLTTILGYAQRLLTSKHAAAQSEEARQIHQEAERASRIFRQLLSHARETPFERRSLSLNQVVLRTLELRRFGLAAEKINVELDLDPILPPVRGDAGQLQQVLMNLLGNAQHAIEQQGHGGTIRVRTCHEGEHVSLTVEDTGPGIPQAILARVFDPFFTTKPAGVGTGLGLSIVLSIAREHGGRVRVVSPHGKGASFTVELPALASRALQSADADTREHGHRKAAHAGFPSATGAIGLPANAPTSQTALGKRILIVEDEPTVARLIADVLEEEGFGVHVSLDGREALERATRESFDLVICDMKMPGLDGQHFYKSLQRTANFFAGNFLFVTGDTIGPQTQAFLSQHRLAYLSKPFRLEELTEHVWRALHQQGPGPHTMAAPRENAARNG